MKKSQATIIISVITTVTILIILGVWAYDEKLPPGAVDTKAIETRINRCITLSANEVFSTFGKLGRPGQTKISVQIGDVIENIPFDKLTLDSESIEKWFSGSITNLTRICVAKIDFAPMNAILLNNPDSLVLTFYYDSKAKMSNVSLNTTLVFGAANKTTVKLTNMSALQLPFAFNAYASALTKIEEQLGANPNYYLTNECQIYTINGQTNITIFPIDEKHTYMEIVDGLPLSYDYKEPYVWREVVAVRSTQPGKCINR